MLQRFKGQFGRWLLVLLCCWPAVNQVQGKTRPLFIQQNTQLVGFGVGTLGSQASSFSLYTTEKDSTRSKVIAAILAFPYPLGMLGLHRAYLGAKPIIPILYFLTFGGIVGILPFIDMMVLILSKDTKPFFKNSKILMWYKKTS